MLESYLNRFTLRKEYFGGLIYDTLKAKVELLSPPDYAMLAKLALTEEQIFEHQLQANHTLSERLTVFKKIGFIDIHTSGQLTLSRTRLVRSVEPIPEGMLTAPIRVFDSITQLCNFECPQCYFSSSNQAREKKRTLKQTADIMRKFFTLGTMEWRFTGGEPTTQPDLFDTIAVGKQLGMNVGLYTNGWWSEATAQKVLDSNLNEIVVSIEGRLEVNDRRRKQGSFTRAVETLQRIKEYNQGKTDGCVQGIIATAIGRDNVNEIEFLAKLAANYGFDINFMPLKPSGRTRNTLANALLSPQEYMQFAYEVQRIRQLPEIRKSGIKVILKYKDLFCGDYPDKSGLPFPFNYSECGALTTAVSILPDGKVYSCPFVLGVDPDEEFMGPNMIDVSAHEAWFHPNLEKFRSAAKTDCIDCGFYIKQCRGACRATVLGNGGEIRDGKLIGRDLQCFAPIMGKVK
jgi:uncharacterized protein